MRGSWTYHVECDDILEGYFTSLVLFDEDLVNADGRGTGRKAKNERMFWGWCEGIDAIYSGTNQHL